VGDSLNTGSAATAEASPRLRRRAFAGALRTFGAALCLATLVASSPAGALAQREPPASGDVPAVTRPSALVANPDSALARTLAEIQGQPLSLADAVGAALQGSTDVRIAAARLRAARGAARRERGAFDPELFADVNHLDQESPSSSVFAGTSLETTTASGGARITLPFGTQLSASLDAVKTETNAPFTLLSPQYDATGRLSVRQPLLRGFGPGTWSEKSATTRELEAARARYDDAVALVRTNVERTYWELYAAERDLAVAQLIRDQAGALLNQAQLRGRAGLVGPGQVATAEVFLAEQEQAVLDRQEALDQASDRLATQIGARPSSQPARFHPSDEPPRDFPVDPEADLVDRALRNNPELRARERDVAAARARHKGAKWNAYPALDVFGTVGGTGLSGSPREVIFGGDTLRTTIDGNLSDAISQARNRDFANWSAGASLTVPIGFRAGTGERDRLQAEADRAQANLVAGQRSLADDVREQHRELLNASARLDAARRGVAASIEQVRIGVLEYNYGRTTAFELSRLSADLAAAQQRYSQALVRTARAAAQLRYLTSGGVPPATPRGEGTE
jgi:outer membrane protein TolC